jgi:DNA-binding NarL/FixJ family response regulator
VLLISIRMPGLDGFSASRRLVADRTGRRIVVLTTFDADEHVLAAAEAGASGFLLTNTPPDRLIDAIRTVHGGDAVISPGPARRLFTTFRSGRRADDHGPSATRGATAEGSYHPGRDGLGAALLVES